jgi:hypothetical protein
MRCYICNVLLKDHESQPQDGPHSWSPCSACVAVAKDMSDYDEVLEEQEDVDDVSSQA